MLSDFELNLQNFVNLAEDQLLQGDAEEDAQNNQLGLLIQRRISALADRLEKVIGKEKARGALRLRFDSNSGSGGQESGDTTGSTG